LIDHPHKILWFIHHIRVYYDLWDSEYRDFPEDERHLAFRDALHQVDSKAIHEARAVFTNSKAVSARLKRFNGIDSEVLYPPVLRPERFRCDRYGDEIVVVARLEHHKRPHLLIEALALTTSAVQLRLVGAAFSADYVSGLTARTHNLGLDRRVTIENRWISEEEKADLLAGALATAYIAFDEDSYGYGSVEASHARKPILTTTDAGGVLELVKDGVNGYVTAPTPAALAEAMDKLFLDRKRTEAMGSKAADRLVELGVTWERVLDRLLA
jgi:glycosyltransferase involved in cell wall biosynthesis